MKMWMDPMRAGHMILANVVRVRKIFSGRDVDRDTTVLGMQCNTIQYNERVSIQMKTEHER